MAAMAQFHKSGSKELFYGIAGAPPREETAKRFLPQAVLQMRRKIALYENLIKSLKSFL